MAEIDDELVARAIRWCGEAGSKASPDEVRVALAPLSWDELLAARALLADPPPARPIGPGALADLARGATAEEAASRRREGRQTGCEEPAPEVGPTAAALPPRPRGRRKKVAAQIVIRRARDRAGRSEMPAPPALPLLDELERAEGRAVLERLVRRHGGRRARILAALAAGWQRADGSAPDAADVTELFESHGLARGFERRERDEAIHAVRAAGGLLSRAAADLGVEREDMPALLARVGAAREVAAIRERKRDELRRRATLSERARLLCEESDGLADLDVLTEFEADLRARLPELLRALRAAAKAPLAPALADSLALPRPLVEALVRRLGIELPITERQPRPERIAAPLARAPFSGAQPVRRPAPAGKRTPRPSAGGSRPASRSAAGGRRPPTPSAAGSRPSSRPAGWSRPPPRTSTGGSTPASRLSAGGSRRPTRPSAGATGAPRRPSVSENGLPPRPPRPGAPPAPARRGPPNRAGRPSAPTRRGGPRPGKGRPR